MMNDNDYNHLGNQIHWEGSTYSTNHYRVEDLKTPPVTGQSSKKHGRKAAKVITLVLCCALAGGGAGVGGAALYNNLNGSSSSPTIITENKTVPSTTVKMEQSNGVDAMSLTDIYYTYVNSCVVITCQTTYTTNTWFGPSSGTATSAGSGFVISDNGYIVTNYHVIDGAEAIKISFYDGSEYEATYVGGEESNDVAVLKIDATGLTPVVLGDSDSLLVGETVSTIGNALGSLSFSQTSGAVSGLGRSVTYSDGTIINMIQTDCTINSGNSGGPLFDGYGRVVGITSAKYSNNGSSSDASIENIGFAIPINDVKSIITDIMEHGYVIRPSMGITVATVTEEYSQYFGWPSGVYVNDVSEGSCAETAGIKKGDIILKLGDTEVTSISELTAAKNQYNVGDTVDVTLYRSGESVTVSLTFDASENPTTKTEDEANHSSSNSNNQQGNQGYNYSYSFPYGY